MKFKQFMFLALITIISFSHVISQSFGEKLKSQFGQNFGTGDKNFQIYNKTDKNILYSINTKNSNDFKPIKKGTAESAVVSGEIKSVYIDIPEEADKKRLRWQIDDGKKSKKYFLQLTEEKNQSNVKERFKLTPQSGLASSILGQNIKKDQVNLVEAGSIKLSDQDILQKGGVVSDFNAALNIIKSTKTDPQVVKELDSLFRKNPSLINQKGPDLLKYIENNRKGLANYIIEQIRKNK